MLENKYSKNIRAKIILSLYVFFIFVVLSRYFYLQVIDYSQYSKKAGDNIVRKMNLHAPRGIIVDRNLVPLVDNQPIYNLKVVPSEVDSNFNYDLLKNYINIDKNYVDSMLNEKSKYRPVLLYRNIDARIKANIEEHKIEFMGTYFEELPARTYLGECNLSHVIGYLSKPDKHDLNNGYGPNDLVPKNGLEKFYEEDLKGKKGLQYYIVNASGVKQYTLDHNYSFNPESGKKIILTIDSKLQKFSEDLLSYGSNNGKWDLGENFFDKKNNIYDIGEKYFDLNSNGQYDEDEPFEDKGNGKYNKGELFDDKLRGSIIIMNPDSGEILSLVSYPDYQLSSFKGIDSDMKFEFLADEKYTPLLNRSINGTYPPGSIFKLLSGLIFLDNQFIDKNYKVDCKGVYSYNENIQKKCWKEEGHGEVDLHKAITQSCNVYFYDIYANYFNSAQGIDRHRLNNWYNKIISVGFFEKVNFDLDSSKKGFIPNYDYLKRNKKVAIGEILNLAIGQGNIEVTPMQIIQFINFIANDGLLYKPYLNKNNSKAIDRSNLFDVKDIEIIKSAMYDVVNNQEGTARNNLKINNSNHVAYGKTGTAQDGNKQPHSWFAGFIELDNNTKYTICVIIENGGSGSNKAVKISNEIFNYISINFN